MSKKIIVIIAILMVFAIIPASNAQLSLGAEADQKSIEVKISSSGEINVKHVVKPSNIPVNVDLFDGTISDISITSENGNERDLTVVDDNDAVLIFPSNQNSIVEYNLEDVLILNDNLNLEYYNIDLVYALENFIDDKGRYIYKKANIMKFINNFYTHSNMLQK